MEHEASDYDSGYETGAQDGYEEGYGDGYEKGHGEGYKEGHSDGYEDALLDIKATIEESLEEEKCQG